MYEPEYSITIPSFDQGIDFFSRFENGNLKKAIRISKTEYELHLSEDYGTTGHYHWFYFKTIAKFSERTTVTFSIINMIKQNSLYGVGFRPFVYLVNKNEGWVPGGEEVSYTPNHIDTNTRTKKRYYTLRWKYTYETDNSDVYFAQFIPYTYSDLLKYLKTINNKDIIRIDVLCKTLANNPCTILTITENIDTYLSYQYEREIASKPRKLRKALRSYADKLRSKFLLKRGIGNYHTESFGGRKNKLEREVPESQEIIESFIGKTKDLESRLLKHKEDHGQKKGVVITARVHPGNSFSLSHR